MKFDIYKNYFISKNEWLINLIKLLEYELPALDKEDYEYKDKDKKVYNPEFNIF